MCWEDIKIARSLKTKVYSDTGDLRIGGNPNRIALRLQLAASDLTGVPAVIVNLNVQRGVESGSQTANLTLASVTIQAIAGAADPVAVVAMQLESTVRLEEVGDILKGNLFIDQTGVGRWFLYESSLETEGPPTQNYGNY